MVAQYLDLTADLAANGFARFEVSNYDYAVIQLVGSDGFYSFTTTLDSGAVQGVTDGDISTSVDYLQVAVIKLADNTYDTSVSGDGLFRLNVVGRYVQITGTEAGKLLVMLTKIG